MVGLLVLLQQQAVVRSLMAVVSHRPYLTVSATGIIIDGGPLDRWSFSWSEIQALASEPNHLRSALREQGFVTLTLRVWPPPPVRRHSELQHLMFRDIIEVSGYFASLSPEEIDALVLQIEQNVEDLQPFLISDWEPHRSRR